jgi:hypothetical protein
MSVPLLPPAVGTLDQLAHARSAARLHNYQSTLKQTCTEKEVPPSRQRQILRALAETYCAHDPMGDDALADADGGGAHNAAADAPLAKHHHLSPLIRDTAHVAQWGARHSSPAAIESALAWDTSVAPLVLGQRYDDGVLATDGFAYDQTTQHLTETLETMLRAHDREAKAIKLTRFDSNTLDTNDY